MKDARFKELLNLHLDHRLTPAEAEELEAALRADPARRKALRDYEAMQSACAALFERSAKHAPSSRALLTALRRVEHRIEHPRSVRNAWGWPTWGLTGGLAACVALVVARLTLPTMNTAQEPASSSGEPEGGTAIAASAVTRGPSLASSRATSPSHLTFAALGLNPNASNADAASRWILQADEPAVYATIEQANAAGDAMAAWSARAATPVGHFSERPINAWGHSSSGGGSFQMETAAYRFER